MLKVFPINTMIDILMMKPIVLHSLLRLNSLSILKLIILILKYLFQENSLYIVEYLRNNNFNKNKDILQYLQMRKIIDRAELKTKYYRKSSMKNNNFQLKFKILNRLRLLFKPVVMKLILMNWLLDSKIIHIISIQSKR